MQLGKVGPLRFREITQLPLVQTRIGLARRVLAAPGGDTLTYHRALIAAQEIVKAVSTEDRSKMGAYLCSGGDVSTFIAATGCHAFLCLDMNPFFGDKLDLPRGEPPAVILANAAREKQALGYWHNNQTWFLGETGIFMLFEILGLAGKNLRVFQADKRKQVFRITFDLKAEKYTVYFAQRTLTYAIMPEILDALPVGVVMIKAGDSQKSRPGYEMLDSTTARLPLNTLIITDRPMNRLHLAPVPFALGEGSGMRPFGYELSRVYLYRVKS